MEAAAFISAQAEFKPFIQNILVDRWILINDA